MFYLLNDFWVGGVAGHGFEVGIGQEEEGEVVERQGQVEGQRGQQGEDKNSVDEEGEEVDEETGQLDTVGRLVEAITVIYSHLIINYSYYYIMQTIEWLLLVVVVVVVREGECQMSLNEYTYKNLGRDWPGTCVAGSMQSPINIANKFNTEIDEDSVVDFDYFLTPDFAARKEKFYYDGRDLELKAKIGNLKFFHLDGS